MRALICSELGPPSKLTIGEMPDPEAGPGQVVVDVASAGLNFPDTLIIEGRYQFQPELPFSPGGEAAGVVSDVGEGVSNVAVGDRVIALAPYGAFAEKWAVGASGVIPVPDALDMVAAAGFGLTYGTSYHALKQRARLRSGETLLVLGAAGGVGSAAIELGKHMGATVIAVTSSDVKAEFAKQLGADHTIGYSNLRDDLKRLTDERGVDVVYDPVGGGVTWGGRHLVVGFAAGDIPELPINLALLKGASLVGVFWGRSLTEEPRAAFQNFVELTALANEGVVKPRVHREFALEDFEAAFSVFQDRTVMGKAVFVI